jgi:hypothetical protein
MNFLPLIIDNATKKSTSFFSSKCFYYPSKKLVLINDIKLLAAGVLKQGHINTLTPLTICLNALLNITSAFN